MEENIQEADEAETESESKIATDTDDAKPTGNRAERKSNDDALSTPATFGGAAILTSILVSKLPIY